MKKKLLISVIISSLFTVILPAKALETRCGWLANPTPANWFLKDRDGTWTLSAQGGYQTTGMENIPDISGPEYVKTNGIHGYACACLEVDTDSNKMRITHVHNAEQLSLSVCQQDKNLSPW
ncbi:MAG: DUF4087 domain-containing protein [Microcoleaceae cyanobacterium]